MRSLALALSAACLITTAEAQSGRIVAHMDDWTHSNVGFSQAPTTANYYRNMADWFAGGTTGSFVVYSAHQTFNGNAFYDNLAAAGHTVVRDTVSPPTLGFFQSFDGVFLCSGPVVDMNVLIQYVQSGGSVYVAAGTSSMPAGTADYWNPFLSAFGLEFDDVIAGGCNGVRPVSGAHPLLDGVTGLYMDGPQPILDLDLADASGRAVAHCGSAIAIAVYGDDIGIPLCHPPVPNSTGGGAYIQAAGSTSVADQNVVLSASGLPPSTTGYFLSARAYGSPVMPPNSQGFLCLSGSIGRFSAPDQIQSAGAGGTIGLELDLTRMPTPTGLVNVMPGETWVVQAWYRDANPGSTSNFTDALLLTFL